MMIIRNEVNLESLTCIDKYHTSRLYHMNDLRYGTVFLDSGARGVAPYL